MDRTADEVVIGVGRADGGLGQSGAGAIADQAVAESDGAENVRRHVSVIDIAGNDRAGDRRRSSRHIKSAALAGAVGVRVGDIPGNRAVLDAGGAAIRRIGPNSAADERGLVSRKGAVLDRC